MMHITAPKGTKLRGVFFVGKTKSLPLEMTFRSDDWKGGCSFDLEVEQSEADQIEDNVKVGFLIMQNLSTFPDMIEIKKFEENKRLIKWTLDNCNTKILSQYYPRGTFLTSPSFEALGVGPLTLEFFPLGSDKCQKQNWCSVRLVAPLSSILHLEFYINDIRQTPDMQPYRYEYDAGYGIEEFCLLDRIEELVICVEISLAEEDPELQKLGINCEEICDYFLGGDLR